MKKLIKYALILILFTLLGTVSYGQSPAPGPGYDYAGRISGPITFVHGAVRSDTTLVTIPGGRSAITFKYDITKTSGTITGTIVLQTHLTPVTGEQWATLNTYTFTNTATTTNLVQLTSNPGLYYRIITTATDTSGNSVHNKYLLYRK